MLKKEMTKKEIEGYLANKGDFVKIDHLERFLKMNPALEKRRFAYEKLAEIYEKKKMFKEVGKAYNAMALASVAFSEKIKNHVKEAEFYIKAGAFERVDEAIKKAMNHASSFQKEEIYFAVKEFYKKQALVYEKQLKRQNAVRIYEKLLQMNILQGEREEIKERLLPLYEKLGKINEYFKLKKS